MSQSQHDVSSAPVRQTDYWHAVDDERVQCDLCPRFCKMREGQRGLCYVRGNVNHEVVLHSDGRSSGFCIDPIEKKPLNHFYPGTPVLSFGTAGCNLACKFCQNWDMSKSREMDTLAQAATPDMIAATAERYGCKSVAFTYNDPIIFLEYAEDTAAACQAKDIKTVAVTAGYICDKPRERFFRFIDAANIDLKAFTEGFYKRICGGQLQNVLDTIKYVYHETNTWLELTTLLIPGENDGEAELTEMCRWVVENLGPDVPLHFTAFHPDWKMLDYPSTPPATLQLARKIGLKQGLRYVYTGNVHDSVGSSTYCHHCNELLVARDWYQLGRWHLDNNGACMTCGTPLAGHFDAQAGHWGAKRLPVRPSL